MKIIAFGHRKRVGKDTACNFVVSHLKLNTRNQRIAKRGFATKMYDILHQLYGWAGFETEDYYEANQEKKEEILPLIGKTPRQLCLDFGTGVAREVYPHTWVDYLSNSANYDYLAIKDMRFENEFYAVKNAGGFCIRIDRPSIPHTDDVADKPLSYLADCAWDAVILNDGPLNDLHANVLNLTRRFLKV